jgi:hypothetical protein
LEELLSDRGRVQRDDIGEHDHLVSLIREIDDGLRIATAREAEHGRPITIPFAVRSGNPSGVFCADRFFNEIGGPRIERELHFENPAVYESQWKALVDLCDIKVVREFKKRYKNLTIPRCADLVTKLANERVVDFWRDLDALGISRCVAVGHDGIIYHHGRKPLWGEYVTLAPFDVR